MCTLLTYKKTTYLSRYQQTIQVDQVSQQVQWTKIKLTKRHVYNIGNNFRPTTSEDDNNIMTGKERNLSSYKRKYIDPCDYNLHIYKY